MKKIPDEQKLLQKILKDYDTAARPVFNASHVITVKFGLTLIQLADMVSAFIAYVLIPDAANLSV